MDLRPHNQIKLIFFSKLQSIFFQDHKRWKPPPLGFLLKLLVAEI
jgi:hypothetical protein